MSTKMTKRELQSPDSFMTHVGSWFNWAGENPRETTIGGVVLVAILVAIGLIFGSGPSDNPKAGAALSAALELADRPVVAKGAEAPEAADVEAEESFASEREKQQAIADALEAVRKEFHGTKSALSATLSLADSKYTLGDHDGALALYDEYLAQAPKSGTLRFLALDGRALALLAKKDFDGSIAAYDRLAKEAPASEDRAIFGKAKVFETQGEWEKARALYEQLQADFPAGSVARSGSEALSALNFRHPPAAPAAEADK